MVFTDQLGQTFSFSNKPKRVISLVPSITEWLVDVGVAVVGRTKFCIHPEEVVKDIAVIGGTKKFRFDVIEQLDPDLIIGNKEENYQEGIEKLKNDFSVWMTDIYSFQDSLDAFDQLSQVLEVQGKWRELRAQLTERWESLRSSQSGSVIYLIWQNPLMAAGKDTYVDHVLDHLGYENLIYESRYPEMTIESIQDLNPEVLMLSSEPFPFGEQHVKQFKADLPNTEVILVDGEFYSWYGTRLLKVD